MLNNVQEAVLIVSVVLAGASVFTVLLRLYDRRIHRKMAFALDDYAMMTSLFFVIAYTITVVVWVAHYNLGKSYHISRHRVRSYNIAYYIARIFYTCAFDDAKIAIILFYIKLTDRVTQTRYWRILQVILGFMIFDFILHLSLVAIPCVPVSTFWSTSNADAHRQCLSKATSSIAINTFTFLSEALIILAPLPLLWLAGLSGKQRIALGFMFSLGFLIMVASALKLRSVIKSTGHDISFETAVAFIWASVEMNVAVLVAGFLPLKALLEANFRRVKRRFSHPNTTLSDLDVPDGGRRKSTPDTESALIVDKLHVLNANDVPNSQNSGLSTLVSAEPNGQHEKGIVGLSQ